MMRKPSVLSAFGVAAMIAITFGLLFPAPTGPTVQAATIIKKLNEQIEESPLIEVTLDSLAIDEFPAIFVAAALADGDTLLSGAEELRVKESDRIAVMAAGLAALGVEVEERPDGMRVRGGRLHGGRVDSHGDHRIAMAFAMAGLVSEAPVVIDDCDNVATSFPGFPELAAACGLAIEVRDTDA